MGGGWPPVYAHSQPPHTPGTHTMCGCSVTIWCEDSIRCRKRVFTSSSSVWIVSNVTAVFRSTPFALTLAVNATWSSPAPTPCDHCLSYFYHRIHATKSPRSGAAWGSGPEAAPGLGSFRSSSRPAAGRPVDDPRLRPARRANRARSAAGCPYPRCPRRLTAKREPPRGFAMCTSDQDSLRLQDKPRFRRAIARSAPRSVSTPSFPARATFSLLGLTFNFLNERFDLANQHG